MIWKYLCWKLNHGKLLRYCSMTSGIFLICLFVFVVMINILVCLCVPRFSFVSGITLLGSPTEVYMYGTQYGYIMGGIFLMSIVMTQVYLPVFHELKITSNYEVNIYINLAVAFTLNSGRKQLDFSQVNQQLALKMEWNNGFSVLRVIPGILIQ